MKHTIIITDTPKSDAELIAAAVAILQLRGVPLATQAKALRDICSFSAMLGQFENGIISRNSNRTPVIKPPLDPEPDCDKEHRLVWRSGPVVPPSPVEAIPAPSAGVSGAPAAVLPSPAPTQPVEPPIPPRSAGALLGKRPARHRLDSLQSNVGSGKCGSFAKLRHLRCELSRVL